MKKILSAILVAAMSMSLVACAGSETANHDQDHEHQSDKISVGFVTDIGGIDDKSFNQTSYEGVKKAGKELGLEEKKDYRYIQSSKEAEYIPNLSAFADDGVDLIVAAGFLFAPAIEATANTYPDQKMLIIDVDWLNNPNVQQATFAENEGSFLVGVAAGLKAKKAGHNKLGFIIGDESVTMDRFWAGYQEGVWAVFPEAEIYYDNAESFGSSEIGKTLAAKQYNAGAYIVYHAAGATGNGVISEAAERREAGKDVWVCGVDTDQYEYGKYGDGSKSAVLTSMLKGADTAAYNAVKAVHDGTFKGGVVRYALKDGGVDLPAVNPNLEEDILKEVQVWKEKIIKGEVKVFEVPKKKGQDPRIK